MTDDYTYGTIVKGIVGIGIEEWRLKDTSREAYLVGGRVIVGINGLGSHVPLILIHWFAGLLIYLILIPKLFTFHNIVIV